ncbi:hypothetical protein GCM10009860_08070 [Microbacterium mitrae]|uniref:DUF4352 domain-containing protein n=1 Tax=Microbacterium mitrae TaxID=664640 RepID=A0A5C8HS61_9MICO|nr:hypothetical protein [Microbacterium mitrae]TXK06159.1 hypothetical protein FVP60_04160 [Microbacterium mitrae]
MAINKPAAASIAALALVLGLAGCSSTATETEKTEKPVESSTSETQKPEKTTEPEESEDAGEAESGDVATPGTTVAVGEEAVVPWGEAEGATQPVSITVKSITAGTIDDFAVVGADFQAKLEGYTPYYITVEAKKVDLAGAPLAYQSLYGDMGGIDADGRSMSPVSIIGDFEPCNTASLDATFDEGTPQTFCYIVAGPDTGDIGGATFEPYDSDFKDEPVVWTK